MAGRTPVQAPVVHQPRAEGAHTALERGGILGVMRRLIERRAAASAARKVSKCPKSLLLAGRDPDDDDIGLVGHQSSGAKNVL